jgi:hypothetical protein
MVLWEILQLCHKMLSRVPSSPIIMSILLCRAVFTPYIGADYQNGQATPPAYKTADVGKGLVVVDALECAEGCVALPGCNAASYYGDLAVDAWPAGKNCWPKSIEYCGLPPDAEKQNDARALLIMDAAACAPPLPTAWRI